MEGKEDSRLYVAPWYDATAFVGFPPIDISDTGQPVFLPFRMSCFVLSNLIVTAGMLTPGLQV